MMKGQIGRHLVRVQNQIFNVSCAIEITLQGNAKKKDISMLSLWKMVLKKSYT